MADLVFESIKSKEIDNIKITIFTATFNRAKTLTRTYESIKDLHKAKIASNIFEFEWLLVDDGSMDETSVLAKGWCEENIIPIRCYKQSNQGKHVAMNFAVQHARGEFWISIDSDDAILPDALQTYMNWWYAIPIENRKDFCGVSARAIGSDNMMIGIKLPYEPMDITFTELRLKYKIKEDFLEMFKVDILKKYPFPTYDERMRFCPESLSWFEMAKKYKLRIINTPTLLYYHDDNVSLMKTKNIARSVSNYYLWLYYINNMNRYWLVCPLNLFKAYVGITMDGLIAGKKFTTIISDCRSWRQVLVTVCMPIGLSLIHI